MLEEHERILPSHVGDSTGPVGELPRLVRGLSEAQITPRGSADQGGIRLLIGLACHQRHAVLFQERVDLGVQPRLIADFQSGAHALGNQRKERGQAFVVTGKVGGNLDEERAELRPKRAGPGSPITGPASPTLPWPSACCSTVPG